MIDLSSFYFFFFFFQAEDGIRDLTVTGVQTCALPIWLCTRKMALAITASSSTRFRRSMPRPPLAPDGACASCRHPGAAGHAHHGRARARIGGEDRKSTRLNSSHSQISYAVFCLKKKKK